MPDGAQPRPRGGLTLVVEPMSNGEHPYSGGVQLEDSAEDCRLLLVDPPGHALAYAVWTEHLDVVVPVDLAAGDVEGLGLSKHGVVGALACFLPLHLRGEVGEREHDFVHRAIEGA